MQKQDLLKKIKVDHLLFDLFHLHSEKGAIKKSLAKKADEEQTINSRFAAANKELNACKMQLGGYSKEKLLKTKEQSRLQGLRDKQSPPLMAAKVGCHPSVNSVNLKAL